MFTINIASNYGLSNVLIKIISILFVDHGSCSPWGVNPRRLIWVVNPGLPLAFTRALTISSS